MSDDQLFMFEAPARERRPGKLPAPASASPLSVQPPSGLYLGTSSWSFPGWKDLVWDAEYGADTLARNGLAAYAAVGLFRSVGIDRTYYEPIDADVFAAYAGQVRDGFRFLVKAPQLVTDAVIRADTGQGRAPNPCYLDSDIAIDRFIVPAIEGLEDKAGPLVFQFPPAPREILHDPAGWVERLGVFLEALPRDVGGRTPVYAVELRNPELLTPRLMRMLRDVGVRYVVGLHDRMPSVARQVNALRVLDDCPEGPYAPAGPVIVRWNLRPGFRYEQAKNRYFPFNRLIDEDPQTRQLLARLAQEVLALGRSIWIIANNKAEGSAPLTLLQLYTVLLELMTADQTKSPV
ncbi:DUF72 domain-containing protein [Reyranella sp. CPCC 100927]|uniref:DUF72 domain-containing protein n=1 Tax=Reyranella sp. CPCC 100927 TaxID=2599616 RepID=UPI0011B508EF|nr:DUF72 domain-containing protein [Reyranella sp. CPCC 100927]TWT09584.1 DUF72 domain-containing protein [Reyranella sp. CPCC 100927]